MEVQLKEGVAIVKDYVPYRAKRKYREALYGDTTVQTDIQTDAKGKSDVTPKSEMSGFKMADMFNAEIVLLENMVEKIIVGEKEQVITLEVLDNMDTLDIDKLLAVVKPLMQDQKKA